MVAGFDLLARSAQGEPTADQQAIAALRRLVCPNDAECDARPADAFAGPPSAGLSAMDAASVLSCLSVSFGYFRHEPFADLDSGVISAGAPIGRARSPRAASDVTGQYAGH
jgi:hypothetical protein